MRVHLGHGELPGYGDGVRGGSPSRAAASSQIDNTTLFQLFKAEYNVSYETAEEEAFRLSAFYSSRRSRESRR